MYAGHLGVALAARGLHARAPLWLFLVATQAPDWLAIALGAAGIADPTELWSHSIPAIAAGAALLASLWWLKTRALPAALMAGGVYLTHPVLDLVTGLKPTWAGGPMIGMCLYDSPGVDFIAEGALVLIGVRIYRRSIERRERLVPRLMVAVLLLCQAGADAVHAHRLEMRTGDPARTRLLQCRVRDPAAARADERTSRRVLARAGID